MKNTRKSPKDIPKMPLGFISDQTQKPPRKRLFIGLIAGTSILFCLLLLLGWVIPYVGFGNIHPLVPYITGIFLIITLCVIAWAALGMIIQILLGKPIWGAKKMRGTTIKFFLPLMELFARFFGFSVAEVRRSFIKVNNQLTLSLAGKIQPSDILLLLPHCVQQTSCTRRLSHSIDYCQRCGLCPVGEILTLRDKYGIKVAVATGGTIARRIVIEARPRLIIAVACERDLASGIQDTHPLPVFGILNARPEGPCKNTQVSLCLVTEALERFICLPVTQ